MTDDPPRKRGRGQQLDAADLAVWRRVVGTLTPLRKPGTDLRATAARTGFESRPSDLSAPRSAPSTAKPVRLSRPVAPAGHPGPVGRPEPGLDRRTADRLRKGARPPDDRIDLHGLTTARAHARLDAFMTRALAAGHRCVLVITGKGGRRKTTEDAPFMAPDRGVLRDAAPSWLRSGPYRNRIVGIYEAHQRHGGAGAFYVYLKKPGAKT